MIRKTIRRRAGRVIENTPEDEVVARIVLPSTVTETTASLTDDYYVTGRFFTLQSRHHIPEETNA